MKTFIGKSNFRAKPPARVSAMAKRYGILEIPKKDTGEPPLLEFNSSSTIASSGSLTNVIGDSWTVVRNSAATYIDDSGILQSVAVDVPRIEESSVLIEASAQNVLIYSDDFTNAAWEKANISVSGNNTTSPDGTINADRITDTSTTSWFRCRQTFSGSLDTDYETSIFAKAGTMPCIQLGIYSTSDSSAQTVVFDLENGVIGETIGSYGSVTSSSITALADGWYKCIVVSQLNVNTPNKILTCIAPLATGNITNSNIVTYTGDSTGTIYYYGANCKLVNSSYIATTSSAATREADVITIAVPAGASQAIDWIDGVEQSPEAVTPATTYTMKNGTTKVVMR